MAGQSKTPAGRPVPAPGMDLFITGGFGRRQSASGPRPCRVAKVGREYFYVEDPPGSSARNHIKFRKDDWSFAGDSNWTYALYPSLDEYEARQARERRMDAIERFFRAWGNVRKLSDESLAEIYKILAKEKLVPPEDGLGENQGP